MSFSGCTESSFDQVLSFSGNAQTMGGEPMFMNSIIFAFGDKPNDINKFYRTGNLILKKPEPPRIFIRNMRTRANI